jgi:cytoskeleton protein RodZ
MLVLFVETGVTDIGGDLRQARLARKRSIEDISRATKITPTQLRAIENDAFARLPGGLFTRGFLRAYAREVGLDPEEMVERYRAEFEPVAAPSNAGPEPWPESERFANVGAPALLDEESVRARHIRILQLCIILLIVALYFAVSRRPKTPADADVKPVAPPVAASKAEAETPVATNGTLAAPAAATPLTLELRPQGPCWVEATADGERVIVRLMDAGQTATVTIQDTLVLRVGDPGALAFSIDGAPGRSLGEAGRPVTVRLDRQNYKTFLQPQDSR